MLCIDPKSYDFQAAGVLQNAQAVAQNILHQATIGEFACLLNHVGFRQALF